MATYVTKSFLPPFEQYTDILKQVWNSGILTNQGPCVNQLEEKLSKFLNIEHLHYVNNGTIALQLALHTLGVSNGEVITTPFSYVATTSSILWERCKPVFVDIEPNCFTLDTAKIEAAITKDTKAIMAVHVFGYPCHVEMIQNIADKYSLKVIYDGAHAFGVEYKGKSLLSYGDISTLSFHATKLFHTVEGGACIVRDKNVSDKLEMAKKFGHIGDDHFSLGVNAKASEFHAAMGLVNIEYIKHIIEERKYISEQYSSLLDGLLERPVVCADIVYNYAYYPVIFQNEEQLLHVFNTLVRNNIHPRRYFYPSLNTLPYVEYLSCPISEDISTRILCLPLYNGLSEEVVEKIVTIIKNTLII